MTKVYTDNNSLVIKYSTVANGYNASDVAMLEEKCIAINKKPHVPYYH